MPKLFEMRLTEVTSSITGVGLFVFVVYALAAVAQLIIGSLIDRHALGRIFLVIALMQIPAFVLTGIVGGFATLFAAIPMMFVVFGLIPINEVMVARYSSPEYRTRIYSVRYTLTFAAVAAAIPTVSWFHTAYGDFGEMFVTLGAMSVVLSLAAVALVLVERHVAVGAKPVMA
jgi:MFS family permease